MQLSFLTRLAISVILWTSACSVPTARPNFASSSKQGGSADIESEIDKPTDGNDSDKDKPSDTGESVDNGTKPDDLKPTPEGQKPVADDEPEVVPIDKPVVVMPDEPTDACKSFSWETIKTPEDALCFKSIDEVIASVPQRVRSNFVLIRKTRSAQPATLDKPRVIIAAPDGSFLIGAATDQEKSKDIELAVYDYKKNVWDFAGIDFTQSPPKVERELCKSCHGLEPHPIWTEYPNWPSAFSGETQLLTNEEAAIMNAIANKTSTLPFVKHLVTQKSYRAGQILYPASKYTGAENNQTLNIVIAIRAARSAVSKLYAKNPSETTLLKIAGEQMCGGRGKTIDDLGLDLSRELNHGLIGQDREQVIWSGNAMGSYFVGIEILNQVFSRNPAIAEKLPTVATMVNRAEFKLYQTESLKDFFAAEDAIKGSWQKVDNGFFRGTFKSTFKSGSQACKELGL